MKQILIRLYIFIGLFGLISITCFGSYTVQIAASKKPTDIKWFSAKYNMDLDIREFRDKGWYNYIIGEFDDLRQASAYISNNLADKGLPHPFPRILPDTFKLVAKNTPITKVAVAELKKPDSVKVNNTNTPKPAVSKRSINSQRRIDRGYEKYGPWARIISMERLHKVEVVIVEGAKWILPRSVVPFYERMIDKAIRYPIVMFFILLIGLFVLNAILIIIILELSNTIKNRQERHDQLYTNIYERALTGYLFQEYELEEAVKRLKDINQSRNRRILIAVLFNFKKNLSGELNNKLLEIFSRLEIENDSYRKTKSYSFYKQILGIRELTNLHPKGALPIVETHINDSNDELRAEAQTSYVRLNHDEPFKFLGSLRKPFTRWTQLTSFYIFKLHMLPAPSFGEHLKSDLFNVRNFSLRMIIFYQQKENAEEIIKLLHTEREMTRFLAIRAVNELGIHEAKPVVKKIYEKETYKNQREIIKGFLHNGDSDDFAFLENIIRQNDITLKIEACRSMYFMNAAGAEQLLSYKQEPELNIEPFIAHIYDPRN